MSRHYDEDFAAVFGGPDRGDIAFFCGHAAAARGPICEVGAGTGRVLLPVARVATGVPVVGVEPSAAMRARCGEQLEVARGHLGERVRVVDGTFGAIPLATGSQALVYSAFRSFQHLLDVDAQLAGLAELRRVLAPDGVLVMDLFDPDYALLIDTEPDLASVYSRENGRVIERYETRRLDRVRQCVEVRFRWIERASSGEVVNDEEASYVVRYTFPWELVHLLARTGFELEALHGDYDGRPVEEEPCELIAVARPARG